MQAKLSVDQALKKARSYAKKGELLESQKLYKAVLLTFPKNKRAQDGLDSLNKYEENNLVQNSLKEQINQLINLYNLGKPKVVVDQAEMLVKKYPYSFIIWNILGVSLSQMGMIDAATEAYKKSILLNPNYAEVYNNMGMTLRI